MTDSTEELEKAQKNQKETGLAGSAENLREEAARAVDDDEESSETS